MKCASHIQFLQQLGAIGDIVTCLYRYGNYRKHQKAQHKMWLRGEATALTVQLKTNENKYREDILHGG